jgi:hypothetical protein
MNHHMPHPAAVERAMSAAQQLLASLGADAEEDIVLNTLEGETDVLEVAKSLVRAALDAEAMAKAAKARIEALEQRHDRFEARAWAARETVKQMLDALNLPKLLAEDFTVSLRMTPPKVLITDEALLQDEFVVVKRSPNRTAIGKALDEGREVVGAVRSNGNVVLSIRTK